MRTNGQKRICPFGGGACFIWPVMSRIIKRREGRGATWYKTCKDWKQFLGFDLVGLLRGSFLITRKIMSAFCDAQFSFPERGCSKNNWHLGAVCR